MSKSGPPELPRLMGASVWIKSSYGPAAMSRLRAETMPAVTELPSPNGSPIAMTQSPTCARSESPNSAAVSGDLGCTRTSARSVVEGDGDRVCSVDNVLVGDDQSRRIDDEARTKGGDAAGQRFVLLHELLEEVLESGIVLLVRQSRQGGIRRNGCGRGDVHHGR